MGLDLYAYNQDDGLETSVCLGSYHNLPDRLEACIGLEERFNVLMLMYQGQTHFWTDDYLRQWVQDYLTWYELCSDYLSPKIMPFATDLRDFFASAQENGYNIRVD